MTRSPGQAPGILGHPAAGGRGQSLYSVSRGHNTTAPTHHILRTCTTRVHHACSRRTSRWGRQAGCLPARPRWRSHTCRTGRCPEARRGTSPLRKTANTKTRHDQVPQPRSRRPMLPAMQQAQATAVSPERGCRQVSPPLRAPRDPWRPPLLNQPGNPGAAPRELFSSFQLRARAWGRPAGLRAPAEDVPRAERVAREAAAGTHGERQEGDGHHAGLGEEGEAGRRCRPAAWRPEALLPGGPLAAPPRSHVTSESSPRAAHPSPPTGAPAGRTREEPGWGVAGAGKAESCWPS